MDRESSGNSLCFWSSDFQERGTSHFVTDGEKLKKALDSAKANAARMFSQDWCGVVASQEKNRFEFRVEHLSPVEKKR